jgi:hypothetical protein
VTDSVGAPEKIRTPDPQIRSLVLYPTELRALLANGAGESLPQRCNRSGHGSSLAGSTYLRVRFDKGKAGEELQRLLPIQTYYSSGHHW